MFTTLAVMLFGFLLGVYAKRLVTLYQCVAECLATPLPDTRMLPINPDGPLPQWAIKQAGYYLVRRNGCTVSEYLTPYAVWLYAWGNTSEYWDAVPLKPATSISGYVATTPTGGKYVRRKVERVHRAYVVSYWFPPSPSYKTVGQATWDCELAYA